MLRFLGKIFKIIKKQWIIPLVITASVMLLHYLVGFAAIWAAVLIPISQIISSLFSGFSDAAISKFFVEISNGFAYIGQGVSAAIATVALSAASLALTFTLSPIISTILGVVAIGLNLWGAIDLYKMITGILIKKQEYRHDADIIMREYSIPTQYKKEVCRSIKIIMQNIREIDVVAQYRILLKLVSAIH